MMTQTLEDLRQHELVILRRLRQGPLTEFELVREVAEHSGWSVDDATEKMGDWLAALREAGLVWAGELHNEAGQSIHAAALTRRARELVK